MGKPYYVHPSAFVDGETSENGFVDPGIGSGVRIWHGCHVMAGARIGDGTSLGQNVFVGGSAVIGKGCRIQNNVSVYDGVALGDFVFCGPSMTFTNLSYPLPRAAIGRHERFQATLVGNHASIGAGAVIVCGHELGEGCFVGAGAVVVEDVPAWAMVVGNPARIIGWVCECGHRLSFLEGLAVCDASSGDRGICGARYQMTSAGLVVRERTCG